MRFGKAAHDGKAKTGALVGHHGIVAALAETFEDFFVIFRRNADAGVVDAEGESSRPRRTLAKAVTRPAGGVNLIAFETRLTRIWRSARSSPKTLGKPLSTSATSLMSASRALDRTS